MSNTPTKITNVSLDLLALPSPYQGVLPPGSAAIIADTPTAALAILGGLPNVQRQLQFAQVPTGTALSPHGALLVAETLAATAAACSIVPNTTRFDPATAGGGIVASLPDGAFVGQRKRFVQISAQGATGAVITPAHMADSKTLVATKCLNAWAELEWMQAGWGVVGCGGPTGPCVTIQ